MAEGTLHGAETARSLARSLAELSLRVGLVSRALVGLQREGHVAAHAACSGEEGVLAAAALALAEGDWLFAAPRDALAMLGRGVPARDVLAHALGRGGPAAGRSPAEAFPAPSRRVVPAGGLPGAHLPHATGCAWAARTRGEQACVLATLERRMVPSGHFHNAVNFAGVFRAPIVFLCREDGRVEDDEPDAAARGVAYGVPSVAVDGDDPLAVHAALASALERARAGEGPALVEVRTRPEADPDAEVARSALARLTSPAGLAPEAVAALREAVAREVAEALAAARTAAAPAAESLVAHVFAAPPPYLAAQRDSLARTARPADPETPSR